METLLAQHSCVARPAATPRQPRRVACLSGRQLHGLPLRPAGVPAAALGGSAHGRRGALRVSATSKPVAAAVAQQAAAVPASAQQIVRVFRTPGLTDAKAAALLKKMQKLISPSIKSIETELCYNIAVTEPLTAAEKDVLMWLIRETYEPAQTVETSVFGSATDASVVEVGPRLNFSTAWSANAVSIFRSCGLTKVTRAECSRRFRLRSDAGKFDLSAEQLAIFAAEVHDRMTECVYNVPLSTFASNITPKPVITIPVMAHGQAALEAINKEMGLAFDEWDLQYYTSLFKDDLKRDPTNVELFDIAQSNSEHSRHWFFRGAMTVDGVPIKETLFKMVKATLDAQPHNSVIGFNDNSSAIRGYDVDALWPATPGAPSALVPTTRPLDILFTAETHNFPCAVAPYPGAETGTGGRIRDTHATGIGSIVVAATAGYCVGNLGLDAVPGLHEDAAFEYPANLAAPLKILLDASNGASDYGNKFGEPLIQGFCRSFGLRTPDGERREWLKPIMFSGGIGQIDHRHLTKKAAEMGMLVVKLGGPAYRIGLGGGAASSMTSGTNDADLDFNAVQRGDAEMAHKLNRVVRACVELGAENPILSIHDQGAGGNCNVVKEIIYPGGGTIDIRAIQLGDETMSVLDIWGAEYQENDALLIAPGSEALLRGICARERCPISIIGAVSDTGRILLVDSAAPPGSIVAEDLELDKVLGDLPQKKYDLRRVARKGVQFIAPEKLTAQEALKAVVSLVSVGSKRFLTSKVDRSVTGLVAQQQCCGPLHLPVSDVAVISQGFFGLTGAATAVGEQPIKGLLNPAAMARLTLGESLTNLVWARVSSLNDVKASGNWMYASKLPGEGADLYDACVTLRDTMIALGVAIDGGKDSLSMAAAAGGETVKAPGELVVSLYCTCPDITLTVTPNLKLPDGVLLHVDLAAGKRRLGGSALAHAYGQIGDETPDMDDVAMFKRAFEVTQTLVGERKIASGHDISDGGLITALLEMAFAGNCGVSAALPAPAKGGALAALFAEELGLLLEVSPAAEAAVVAAYSAAGVPVSRLGRVAAAGAVDVTVGGQPAISGHVAQLRDAWETTAFKLERLQSSAATVAQEEAGLASRRAPTWHLPYAVVPTPVLASRHRVAVLREEGTNGDREMAAAVQAAGFEPWDVTMSDLLEKRIALDAFRGIIFAGGFSYADVLDSAKGWAGAIKFNPELTAQFNAFYARQDTFSLGVCNGCQLMALLGWVPGTGVDAAPLLESGAQPRFVRNASGRFESRFVTVRVLPDSPAIMLQGMEGLQMGVWSAHGEGRVLFPDSGVQGRIMRDALAPIRYVDDDGAPTDVYPFNPNGSADGIAALCSPDGRHLAMMPHPERAFLNWQLPWVPPAHEAALPLASHSPWLKLFQNARVWCDSKK